jgi:sugar/nucleoside kinase (ribokinase family)
MSAPPLLCVGSVALDTIETPAGTRHDILGGSAVHFSLAARLFGRVAAVGIVGADFPREHERRLADLGVDLSGLVRANGRTFRWHGRYEGAMNTAQTIRTELNVFGSFRPDVPDHLRDARFVLLGNAPPQTQAHLLNQLRAPEFVLLDSMDLWIRTARDELLSLLPRVTGLSLNDEEARMLADEPLLYRAMHRLVEMGPQCVIVKSAEYGAAIATTSFTASLPAYPTRRVMDPTGAGDAFAGGFLGHLCESGHADEDALRRALAYGIVMGSVAVEGFGTEPLEAVVREEVERRFDALARMCTVPR